MEHIGKRVNELLNHYSLSKAELSRKMGIENNVTLSRICGGQVRPSFEIIIKLLEALPEVNGHWLLRGEGKMLRDTAEMPENIRKSEEIYTYQRYLIELLQKELEQKRTECVDFREENKRLRGELDMCNQELKKKEPNPEH